jgi:GntR family transcriptional repressor for pyruvate dehydrogenase complex
MADVQFQSVKKRAVSREVAGQIKDLILSGKLKPGDKLPGERDLSKALGVGRLSLREALRILESVGILETKYGIDSGTYVSEVSVSSLSKNFSEMLMFSEISIEQLTEARQEIAMILIKHFIQNADQNNLAELEDCLKEAQALSEAGRRTREKSMLFHRLIALGSKNVVFIMLHESLMQILHHFLSKYESPPDHSKKVIENHKRTLKYLKERNLEKASAAMRDHILYVGKRMKSLLEMEAKRAKDR